MDLTPYLFYDGHCDEAIEFYRSAIGAEVSSRMRYKDSPEPTPPENAEKVMHASLRIGDSMLMLSDGHCTGEMKFDGFAITLTPNSEAEAERLFNGLVNGGKVLMPLTKTFFSLKFGMLSDRFGMMWMIYVAP
jgi:PhnB protein